MESENEVEAIETSEYHDAEDAARYRELLAHAVSVTGTDALMVTILLNPLRILCTAKSRVQEHEAAREVGGVVLKILEDTAHLLAENDELKKRVEELEKS